MKCNKSSKGIGDEDIKINEYNTNNYFIIISKFEFSLLKL